MIFLKFFKNYNILFKKNSINLIFNFIIGFIIDFY